MTTWWIYLILSWQKYELDLQKLQVLARHKRAKVINSCKQIQNLQHTFLKPSTSFRLRHKRKKCLDFPCTFAFNLHLVDGGVFFILFYSKFCCTTVSHALSHFSFLFLLFNKPFLIQQLKLELKFQILYPSTGLLHLFELKLELLAFFSKTMLQFLLVRKFYDH